MSQNKEFCRNVWSVTVRTEEELVTIEQSEGGKLRSILLDPCQIDLLIDSLKRAKLIAAAWQQENGLEK